MRTRPPNTRVLRHVQVPDLYLPRMGPRMTLREEAAVDREVLLELSLQQPEVPLRQRLPPVVHKRRVLEVALQHQWSSEVPLRLHPPDPRQSSSLSELRVSP